jgi:hypothetical protein
MKKNKLLDFLAFNLLALALFLGHQNQLGAQEYIGFGWHLSAPVRFDNSCNALFQANPFPASSFSLTLKKNFQTRSKRQFFYEYGLSTAAIGFNEVEHDNDTLSQAEGLPPWGIFRNRIISFPSFLFGMGRSIPIKNGHEWILGLEASARMGYIFGGRKSTKFTLDDPRRFFTFPLFLRANIGYAIPLKLSKQVPAELLFYAKISAQNIAKGGQYIQDPVTKVTNYDGKYRLNNSELGVQFYLDIGKEHYNFLDNPPRERKPKAKRTGKSLVRFSLVQQLYCPPPTKYYVPHVDSFSLKGHPGALTPQFGLKAEFVHLRNRDWATVVAFGTGKVMESHRFRSNAPFTTENIDDYPGSYGPIGRYLIQNIGLSYRHDWRKKRLQHTLTASFVEPVERYGTGYGVFRDYAAKKSVLIASYEERFFHDKVLFGLEYSPEFLYHLDKRVYFSFGLVFNYSLGQLAQGRVTVSNGQTTYYGGMFQGMGKIGLTASMGFQGRRHLI